MTREAIPYEEKRERARRAVADLPSLAVALSGGVDSSALTHLAASALGGRALAVTAVSPSVAADESAFAREVARRCSVEHLEVRTEEMDDPLYRRNAPDRCYFCRRELFGVMERVARSRGIEVIAYGAIADDLLDVRPGAKAAEEFRVLAPLQAAGFTKEDVRRYAREAGLPNAERPASACLASRIPYGTEVTAEALGRVGAFEAAVRGLGFPVVRVRHHGDLARLELDPDSIERAGLECRRSLLEAGRAAGYARVALDLRGYRTGALREALARPGAPDLVVLRRRGAEFALTVRRREDECAAAAAPFVALDLETA